jgi:hypothetical protein
LRKVNVVMRHNLKVRGLNRRHEQLIGEVIHVREATDVGRLGCLLCSEYIPVSS